MSADCDKTSREGRASNLSAYIRPPLVPSRSMVIALRLPCRRRKAVQQTYRKLGGDEPIFLNQMESVFMSFTELTAR